MQRTFAIVLPLLAVLALVPPGKAVAGPPEGASGKMVRDEVADGLRRYRKAASPAVRIGWLEKLALTRDPRVAVALGEALSDDCVGVGVVARTLVKHFFVPLRNGFQGGDIAGGWWENNEADLRRRAKQLPR